MRALNLCDQHNDDKWCTHDKHRVNIDRQRSDTAVRRLSAVACTADEHICHTSSTSTMYNVRILCMELWLPASQPPYHNSDFVGSRGCQHANRLITRWMLYEDVAVSMPTALSQAGCCRKSWLSAYQPHYRKADVVGCRGSQHANRIITRLMLYDVVAVTSHEHHYHNTISIVYSTPTTCDDVQLHQATMFSCP